MNILEQKPSKTAADEISIKIKEKFLESVRVDATGSVRDRKTHFAVEDLFD